MIQRYELLQPITQGGMDLDPANTPWIFVRPDQAARLAAAGVIGDALDGAADDEQNPKPRRRARAPA